MAEKKEAPANPFDPMGAWREGRDTALDAWARVMVDAVNTDAYAQATGAILDSYLTASLPFREAIEKSMVQALQQLSMPSRVDVLSLAERLTNVEMRLDDMDAKLDRIEKALAGRAAPAAPAAPAARKPSRRKKS